MNNVKLLKLVGILSLSALVSCNSGGIGEKNNSITLKGGEFSSCISNGLLQKLKSQKLTEAELDYMAECTNNSEVQLEIIHYMTKYFPNGSRHPLATIACYGNRKIFDVVAWEIINYPKNEVNIDRRNALSCIALKDETSPEMLLAILNSTSCDSSLLSKIVNNPNATENTFIAAMQNGNINNEGLRHIAFSKKSTYITLLAVAKNPRTNETTLRDMLYKRPEDMTSTLLLTLVQHKHIAAEALYLAAINEQATPEVLLQIINNVQTDDVTLKKIRSNNQNNYQIIEALNEAEIRNLSFKLALANLGYNIDYVKKLLRTPHNCKVYELRGIDNISKELEEPIYPPVWLRNLDYFSSDSEEKC